MTLLSLCVVLSKRSESHICCTLTFRPLSTHSNSYTMTVTVKSLQKCIMQFSQVENITTQKQLRFGMTSLLMHGNHVPGHHCGVHTDSVRSLSEQTTLNFCDWFSRFTLLLGPLGQNATPGIGKPVINLVYREPCLFNQHSLLIVIRVWVVLVLSQPVQHYSHRLLG